MARVKGSRRVPGARALLALALAAVLGVALAAVAAQAEVVRLGDVQISVQGAIFPSRLPAKTLSPTNLELSAKIATTDSTHVPRMDTIEVESNRHGYVDTKSIPTCAPSKLLNTLTAQARRACRKALIGTGQASAEIAFPEQPPFKAGGPMLIFNGPPKHGHPRFVFHVYAHVPAPTTFVTTGTIEQGGRRGPHIEIQIPTIVDGQGSLTGFVATVHKVIRANCPAPAGLPGAIFPFAKSTFTFIDGRSVHSVLVRECQVRR
jgi:hypothetical protein